MSDKPFLSLKLFRIFREERSDDSRHRSGNTTGGDTTVIGSLQDRFLRETPISLRATKSPNRRPTTGRRYLPKWPPQKVIADARSHLARLEASFGKAEAAPSWARTLRARRLPRPCSGSDFRTTVIRTKTVTVFGGRRRVESGTNPEGSISPALQTRINCLALDCSRNAKLSPWISK